MQRLAARAPCVEGATLLANHSAREGVEDVDEESRMSQAVQRSIRILEKSTTGQTLGKELETELEKELDGKFECRLLSREVAAAYQEVACVEEKLWCSPTGGTRWAHPN